MFFGTPFANPNFSDFENTIINILAIALLIVFLGSLYAFIVAIFQFIFSRGDETKIKSAGDNIRYIIIGLILITVVMFVGPIVMERIGVPGAEKYGADTIFERMGEIIGFIFEASGSAVNRSGTANGGGEL